MNNKTVPFIITIEGLDGAGKYTTSRALKDELIRRGFSVEVISFPMYEKWHSFLVKWQLKGKFGKDPMKVNPYLASFFYAFDRFFAWHFDLKHRVSDLDFIIFDRYTTSNMIYQAAKRSGKEKQLKVAQRIEVLEYDWLKLPRPKMVVALTTPLETTLANVDKRNATKDIYEKDSDFLSRVRDTFVRLTIEHLWYSVETVDDTGNMQPVDNIVNSILTRVLVRKAVDDVFTNSKNKP